MLMQYEIAICIPVHGPSHELDMTICALEKNFERETNNILLVISNSGEPIENISWSRDLKIINLSSNKYWTGAVKTLFRYVQTIHTKYVLLLNHDCIPALYTIDRLIAAQRENGPKTVCHATLLRFDRKDEVWWAGNFRKSFHLFYYQKYNGIKACNLPREPFETLSTMGQCLLLPIEAAMPEYLYERLTPHYCGDSAMTSLMRQKGFRLLVVPSAFAYTDQSDYAKKCSRITCCRVSDIRRVYFDPVSNRYLKGAFWGIFLQHDNWVSGLMGGIVIVTGKFLKGIMEIVNPKIHNW